MRWRDWLEQDTDTHRAFLRYGIEVIFPDSLMIALSILLIPILTIPFFFKLSPLQGLILDTFNNAILVVFVLEYCLKLTFAENRLKFFLSPWHILDLIIIAFPIGAIIIGSYQKVTGSLRFLRLLRIYALGTRAYTRQETYGTSIDEGFTSPELECKLRILYPTNQTKLEDIPFQKLSDIPDNEPIFLTYPNLNATTWYDFTSVHVTDVPKISRITGISTNLLLEALKERAFPWARSHRNHAALYLKFLERRHSSVNTKQFFISWKWILIVSKDHSILTFSSSFPNATDNIAPEILASKDVLTPAEITYRFFQDALTRIEETLRAMEDELDYTSSLHISEQPSTFLPATFRLKKQAVRMHSWLLHTKDVLNSIVTSKVVLHGMEDGTRFTALLDRTSYLYDISDDITENVTSLTDYYFNTTSFQMGQVMKLIAVLTALSIIPTVVGSLLGSNLIGNPWPIPLELVILVVSILMLATAWVYYRLGWLKM